MNNVINKYRVNNKLVYSYDLNANRATDYRNIVIKFELQQNHNHSYLQLSNKIDKLFTRAKELAKSN